MLSGFTAVQPGGVQAQLMITVFLILLSCAILGVLIYMLYGRFYRDSYRRQKTVRARFLRHEFVAGKIEMQDKTRQYGNTPILVEKHRVIFQEVKTGKELSFQTDSDTFRKWKENQEGFLTYSGRRLIHFQAG